MYLTELKNKFLWLDNKVLELLLFGAERDCELFCANLVQNNRLFELANCDLGSNISTRFNLVLALTKKILVNIFCFVYAGLKIKKKHKIT